MSGGDEQRAEIRRTFATWLGFLLPFTPIGKEGGLKRRPRAVLGLIIANVAIHLVAWPLEQADQRLENQRYAALSVVELDIEKRWLGAQGDELFGLGYSSRLRGRNAFEAKFWQAFEAGRIVDRDHADHRAWERAHGDWREARESRLYYTWGMHPENGNPLSYLTAMFLHFGFLHLFGNMFFLWVAGGALEDVWGPRFLLLLYLAAGLLAEAPDAFSLPEEDIIGAGASGAVAGLMGAFIVKMGAQKMRFIILPMLPTVTLPGWVFFLPWGWFELRNALSGEFTGIAHWVHVGGFAGGALVALIFRATQVEERAADGLARADAAALARKRQALEEQAGHEDGMHDYKRSLESRIEACRADPGAHESYAIVVERLAGSQDAERLEELLLFTLQALWTQGRKTEHARAFAVARRHGADGLLPSIEILHGSDSLAGERPREAAETLHAFLTQRPEDPLVKAALNRYADLLEGLGHAEGAAQARAQAAAVKPKSADPAQPG